MAKKILSCILCLLIIFSFTACNVPVDNDLQNENSTPKEEKKTETKKPRREVKLEDLIEMRGANLWIPQKDLYKLALDGELYEVPDELIEVIPEYDRVLVKYPLLVIGGKEIYNLNEKQVIFSIEDIISSLEKEWGKRGRMELKPDFFTFIDHVSLSPSKDKILFSIHHYSVAIFTSITGIIDVETKEISFIEGPFKGNVDEFRWSVGESYFAYITSLLGPGEILEYIIHVNDANTLKEVVKINSVDLVEEELNKKETVDNFYVRAKIEEWLKDHIINIQLEYVDLINDESEDYIKSINLMNR